MGIKGGYEILAKCGRDIMIKNLSGSTIVIDMMTYIVRFYKLYTNKKWYKKVIEFIGNILKHNINCICIFDGFNKPPEKKSCIQHRKNTTAARQELLKDEISSELEMYDKGQTDVLLQRYPGKTLPEIYNAIVKTLRHLKGHNAFPTKDDLKTIMVMLQTCFGSPDVRADAAGTSCLSSCTDTCGAESQPGFGKCEVYIADGEAENLCCYYLKENRADYVLSEDSDVVLYGATKFLMKFDGTQARLYALEEVLDYHKLTFQELFCLCLLLGTDYDEEGLKGCGYQRGIKLIKTEGLEMAEAYIKNIERMKAIFTPLGKGTALTFSKEEAKASLTLLR
jgi:5'-3' exonuclease